MARRVIWAEHSEPAGKAFHSHQPTDQGHDPLSLPHPWLLLWLPPPLTFISMTIPAGGCLDWPHPGH